MRPLVQNTPTEANETFEKAVQPYMEDLKRYCCSLMKSSWDGEDLMQDTMLKAYKSWSTTYRPVSKSFLFRIACNTWIDGNRKRKPKEDFNRDILVLREEERIHSDSLEEAMQLLLKELSPKQRIAMLLVDGLNYTIQETATLMQTSEGAVKAVLHRARKTVKNRRKQDFFYTDDKTTTVYVTAFQNGKTETLVDLFHQEIGAQNNIKAQMDTGPNVLIHPTFASGNAFFFVAIRTINGSVLFIPFTRSEWLALFNGPMKKGSFAA